MQKKDILSLLSNVTKSLREEMGDSMWIEKDE